MSNLAIKTVEQLEKIEATSKWMIEGLWLNEGIGILCAQPKTGKSWTAMDIAISAASGLPALNKFPVNGTHRVLIFFAEDTESIQRDRIDLIKAAKGITGPLSNLGVMVSKDRLRLDSDEGVQSLRAAVQAFQPTLLILDPFVRMHSISESDSTAVAKILQELRNIKNEFNTGVLLVHHASKGTKDIRGSTEFAAWGETNLFMYKDKTEQVFIDIQHRAAESMDGVALQIGKLGQGTTIYAKDSNPVMGESSTCNPILGESLASKILGAIRSYAGPRSFEQIVERTGAESSQVRNELYRLIKNRDVQWTSKGYRLT